MINFDDPSEIISVYNIFSKLKGKILNKLLNQAYYQHSERNNSTLIEKIL